MTIISHIGIIQSLVYGYTVQCEYLDGVTISVVLAMYSSTVFEMKQ